MYDDEAVKTKWMLIIGVIVMIVIIAIIYNKNSNRYSVGTPSYF